MASVDCILCCTVLTKGNDRNLVKGKGEISPITEINDLDFVVHNTSSYICRSCLRLLQQRRNLKKKIGDLNEKLLIKYQEKAATKGLLVKRKACNKLSKESDGDDTSLEQHNVNTSVTSSIGFLPPSASTPIKSNDFPHSAKTTKPDKSSYVNVNVHWESKDSSRNLPDDLEPLGKMLCRGTYAQIARAAWRCNRIKEQIITLFLKDIDRECASICSKKKPSILRQTNRKSMTDFSLEKLHEELKVRTPLLRSVLYVACFRKSNLERNQMYWMPALCMALSICLKNRSPYMTVLQLLNTLLIYHSGFMVGIKLFVILFSFDFFLLQNLFNYLF